MGLCERERERESERDRERCRRGRWVVTERLLSVSFHYDALEVAE